jgi:hypothetical protein
VVGVVGDAHAVQPRVCSVQRVFQEEGAACVCRSRESAAPQSATGRTGVAKLARPACNLNLRAARV